MSFPLAFLLVPFGLVVFMAMLFFLFNIFHIRRYAIQSTATLILLVAYLIGFFGLLGAIAIYVLSVDWQREIEPMDLLPSFEASSRL